MYKQSGGQTYRFDIGFYPERILADKIYRTRDNLTYCKKNSISMNGLKLGRLPKDKQVKPAFI